MVNGNVKRSEEDSIPPRAFVGRLERKLGRDRLLTIPAKWVACLGGVRFVYVMPDPRERCLDILPASLIDEEMARLRSDLPNDRETQKTLRAIGRAAERLELDRRHRIRISDKLLDFAGIGNRASLLGSVRSVRVWNPDALDMSKG